MLKFGIFTHRNNEFKIDDIDDLFSFLCHILDIFTNRKDFESRSLDLIAQKDEIIEDYTQNNPIQKAAHDIKYRILNKKDWKNTAVEADIGKSKEDGEYRESHIHSKIILEIMEIFHFLFDLRQNYLMENIVEMFYKRVFTRNTGGELLNDEKLRTKAIASMIKDFKKVLPDNSTFSNQLHYNFPSVDEMYEDKEFEKFREEIMKSQLGIDMHDDFLVLLIDTFNVSSGNKFLQQMTLTIICRYYSERSELVRNIDRMCLLFDENEWRFYQWVNMTIDTFTRDTEKSALWLNEDDEYNEHDLIDRVNEYLFNLRAALNQKYEILDSEDGGFEFVPIEGERKINKFAQRVFRSLKVYDHLINFIMKNMKLLVKVRTTDDKEMGETERLTCNNIEKIFRRCLKILEAFTMNNKINQNLMWKYKEIFVFPELGSSEEDGELEFILSIVDQNDQIKITRPLDIFISNLNKRMGHESNFVILLDIFNKLMDFESMGKIKKSLTKLILERKDMLESSKSSNSAAFEASINVKEILLHILQNQELSYAKDSFIE